MKQLLIITSVICVIAVNYTESVSATVACEVNRTVDGISDRQFKTCPGEGDPSDHVACCYFSLNETAVDGDQARAAASSVTGLRCCPPDQAALLFHFISDRLALMIAVATTISLLILTVIVVICCFWSKCPLYMMCRIKYHKDDIIAYHAKDDDGLPLPSEELNGGNTYEPNAVKLTLKEDCD